MSVLKNLKLTDAKPVITNDPVLRSRDKLLASLAEQKAFASAVIAGEVFQPPRRMVSRRNDAGERVRVEAPRRVRKGWFEDAAGQTYFRVLFGGKPLELAKGKTAIEVGALGNLPATIDALVQATRAGELDEQLKAAAAARGNLLKGRKAKAA